MDLDLSAHFPYYKEFDPIVPVWCVTPNSGRIIHRFFDTSPFSPSGRYLALTRFPYEDRLPFAGDAAEIVLINLETGKEGSIAMTHGWDTQLGAQVQWGQDDNQLYFNDLDTKTWKLFGVKMNPITGDKKRLEGPIYMVSPDGSLAASPCLLRTGLTQAGYGVIAPPDYIPVNKGAPSDDGVYMTDTETGKCKLLVSLKQIFEEAIPSFNKDDY